MRLVNAGKYILRKKFNGEFLVDLTETSPATSPDANLARRFSSAYLNQTCWDWPLDWDAVPL